MLPLRRLLLAAATAAAALTVVPAAPAAAPTLVSVTQVDHLPTVVWTTPPGSYPYIIELSTSPALNADGGFANADDGQFHVMPDQTTWTAPWPLNPGPHYVQVGARDMTCAACGVQWSAVQQVVLPPFEVRVTVVGDGTVYDQTGTPCGVPCVFSVAARGSILITATPAPGFHSAMYAGADVSCMFGGCWISVLRDLDLTVTFPPLVQHTLAVTVEGRGSVTSSPEGLDCGADGGPCSMQAFDIDDGWSLAARPADGWEFVGWVDAPPSCVPEAGSCDLPSTADAAVTARFVPLPPTIDQRPRVAGVPRVGRLLTCAGAAFVFQPDSVSYRWERDHRPIPQAYGRTRRATRLDAGHLVRCVVQGTTGAGSVAARSTSVRVRRA